MWRVHANTFHCRMLVPLLLVFLMATCPICKAKGCNGTCGSTNIPYPFVLKGQHCGSQHFELECNGGSPYLPVNQSKYKVLNISRNSITIDPLPNRNCSAPNLRTFNLTGLTQFTISPQNRIQIYNCTRLKNTSSCQSQGINYAEKCSAAELSFCFSTADNQSRDHRSVEDYFPPTDGCSIFTSWVDKSPNSIPTKYGLQLDWALPGKCSQNCSLNAMCTEIVTTREKYYCQCQNGYDGDGYVEGVGCTAEGPVTKTQSISTKTKKSSPITAVTVAGIIGGATILSAIVIACAILRCRQSSLIGGNRKGYIHQLANILALKDDSTTQLFTYKELDKATKSFSPNQQLGSGASGAVYAGKLQDGRLIAVKRIHFLNAQGLQQVVNEVNVLSSVAHKNLVRLLGCCIEKGDPLLVFEHVANGTLAEHLQRQRGQGLDWLTRIAIAAETADALAYLHSVSPPIYHRDVKSRNILLDSNFNAKVADFGLSRLVLSLTDASHISTIPQGTPGYLDPEYHQNFHLSDKSDVYSFGVVLMEIITALKPVDFSRDKKEVNLAALAVAKIGSGCLDDILDPFLQVEMQPAVRSMVQRVAELAFRCLSYDKDARPKMKEVLEELLLVRGASTPLSELSPTGWAAELPSGRSGSIGDRTPSLATDYVPTKGDHSQSPTSVQDPWDSKHTSPTESLTESLTGIM